MLLLHSKAFPATWMDDLLRPAKYREVSLSPMGDKLAAISMEKGKRVLAVMTLAPLKITYVLRFVGDEEVGNYQWVNNERIVTSVRDRLGWLDNPYTSNYLYGFNFDGSANNTLFGYEVGYNQGTTSTRLKAREIQTAHADIITTLPDEPDYIVISTHPWRKKGYRYYVSGDTYGEVLKLNIYSGRTRKIADLPSRGGRGYADDSGTLHFADGTSSAGIREFFQYFDGQWQRIGTEESDQIATPVGFSGEGKYAYLLSRLDSDKYELIRYDLKSGMRTTLYRHPTVDITRIQNYPGRNSKPALVHLDDGKPSTHYLDNGSTFSSYLRAVEQAFPGYRVQLESASKNGNDLILSVSGDDIAGNYFHVELDSKEVTPLLSAASWLTQDQLLKTETFNLTASDGVRLQGYLTFPRTGRSNLPLVVLPHGGPQSRDYWRFDRERQILGHAGYLVMSVNFRGSSGYGRQFETASYQDWGRRVQKDIADATRWVIAKDFADRTRVCIYGASFGAYSAMMGVILEPSLYRCAAGFAGVYDLELMFSAGDIPRTSAGRAYLDKALGEDPEILQAFSPARNADRIKVPVFIAHGGEDQRAPIEQAENFVAAMARNKVDVTTKYDSKGGHGYYSASANKTMYSALLKFFDEHIGQD